MLRILIFLQFTFSICHAQRQQGEVVDSFNLTPIPYASIEVLKKSQALNADEKGKFQLDKESIDTLIVSCIGYETKKLMLDENWNGKVYLVQKLTTLSPVAIGTHDYKRKEIINDFKRCSFEWYTSSGNTKQIAQEYIAEDNCYLKGIKVCRGQAIFNPAGKAIYRIRIYSKSSTNGSPEKELYDEPIEVNSSSNIDKIDLSEKKILISKGVFFISIEWLFIESNKQEQEEKYPQGKRKQIHYKPEIGIEKNESYTLTKTIWQYTEAKGWYQGTPFIKKLRIAALVEY